MTSQFSRFDRFVQEPAWLKRFQIAVAASIIVYLVNVFFFQFDPGNAWGLSYGIASGILMFATAAIGLRRRMIRFASNQRFGKTSVWLQFHLYGGTLSLLLMFMHSGFRIPTSAMNIWLWGLSVLVFASGLFGVLLQKTIPRILASGLSIEVLYDRIPELVRQIRERLEALLPDCTDPVKEFYRKNIAPAVRAPEYRLIYYIDITGGIQAQLREFSYLRNLLSSEEKETLDTIEEMYRTKLEIDAHYTLQKPLRWWLVTHVPLSLALLVLILVHLFAVMYY